MGNVCWSKPLIFITLCMFLTCVKSHTTVRSHAGLNYQQCSDLCSTSQKCLQAISTRDGECYTTGLLFIHRSDLIDSSISNNRDIPNLHYYYWIFLHSLRLFVLCCSRCFVLLQFIFQLSSIPISLQSNRRRQEQFPVKQGLVNQSKLRFFVFFFKYFCVGHVQMSYFGATRTPVLDFWWRLLWVSKPEWVLPLFVLWRWM